ncbi:hypothetical protein HF680_15400 [Brevundimonas sp. WCHBH090558]|uniref:ribbon-helix-helix domain-containing protein n=1 Tax=Brevundimonas huaxiensis TaxID=2725493 RepID=UPI001627C767|nr:ribbon-helix-helix domain-containing protein [Brevundimonas huaxiensis]MBC1184026.1 hypothetical protein [Brevundimonas huaxiensis]
MSRFQALKKEAAGPRLIETAAAESPAAAGQKKKARDGLKPVMGYYSPAVRRTLHQMALDDQTTIQALLGEAIDLLMRQKGKHPFGER